MIKNFTKDFQVKENSKFNIKDFSTTYKGKLNKEEGEDGLILAVFAPCERWRIELINQHAPSVPIDTKSAVPAADGILLGLNSGHHSPSYLSVYVVLVNYFSIISDYGTKGNSSM